MKKNYAKQFISFILSIVLIIVFVISSSASAPLDTYYGIIEMDSNSPNRDLSGIEIKVFSAEPIYDEESHELLYYGETYAFSVFTEMDGSFSFIKPTAFCSVTIDLQSLPVGYGINRQVQFIADGVTSHTFVLSEVEDIDVYMEYGQIMVDFYGDDNQYLHVDYQIEETPLSMEGLSSHEIKQLTSYDVIGKVITPHGETPYAIPVNLSEYSLQEKTDYFYSEGLISEEKKIEVYCDILLDETLDIQLQSGTTIINEVLSYKKNVLESSEDISVIKRADKSVAVNAPFITKVENIWEMVNRSDSSDSAYYQRTMEDGFVFRILYDPNDSDIIPYYINELADNFENHYNQMVTGLDFNAPISHIGGYYEITMINDGTESSKGFTTYESLPGSSKITINFAEYEGENQVSFTVAHELHHAIMVTYGFNTSSCDKWVREGFANMAATICTTSPLPPQNPIIIVRSAQGQIKEYLEKSYLSIFDEGNGVYGTTLYPLYIYENLGGWNTIKEIYTNFNTTNDIYTAISSARHITCYDYAFVGMFSNNYKPRLFYTSLASASSDLDNSVPIQNLGVGTSSLRTLPPMSGHYLQLSSTSNIGTIYVTCTVTSGNENGFFLYKITETSSGLPHIVTENFDVTQITFSQSNFGDTVKKLTLVPMNSKATNEEISYRVSVSN